MNISRQLSSRQDKLKRGVIDQIFRLSNHHDSCNIPSGPVAILMLSALSRCSTSVTKQRSWYGTSETGRSGRSCIVIRHLRNGGVKGGILFGQVKF